MCCNDVIISAQNLGKSYQLYDKPHHRLLQTLLRGKKQFFREFWALQGVSFELRKGESLGILGRNGAGKSTLLQLLSGVLTPTTGSLKVNGRVAALLELGSGFNPEFTGRENAYLNGSILGLTEAEMDAAMPEIERFAGVGDFFDQPVKLYSSGMMVRVAFAVQVQLNPDILIVDEALAVGDAIFQKRCYQRIRELLASGTSLILVTHDAESVRLFAQKGLLLESGKLITSGEVGAVISMYQQRVLEEEKKYLSAYIENEITNNQSMIDRNTTEFGNLEGRVTKVEVLDGNEVESNVFYSGDKVRILVSFQLSKEINSLIISLRIRNKEGVKCYSWGTLTQDIMRKKQGHSQDLIWGNSFQPNTEYTAAFDMEQCSLGAGFYEIEAQLTSRDSLDVYEKETVLHWLTEASFFTVRVDTKKIFFGGICDLRMNASLLQKKL